MDRSRKEDGVLSRTGTRWALATGALLWWSSAVVAQSPTVDSPATTAPGSGESALGLAPGAGGGNLGATPGGQDSLLSGGAGTLNPKVPTSISTPGQERAGTRQGIVPIRPLTPNAAPLFGTLSMPTGPEDEGPSDGLTLDDAIARLIAENIDLRAKALEIPQAQADILTASLRANPIFYADAQLVPYGNYSAKRPGGQTQYDVNISHPLDVSRKRLARMAVASQAKHVIEAQYQDAVRQQIDNLYTAYVDVLSARDTLRFSQSSVSGLEGVLKATQDQQKQGMNTSADVRRVKIQRDNAQLGVADAEESLRRSKRTLALLLGIPVDSIDGLELRGSMRDTYAPPPPPEELIQMALGARPDVVAYRLGIRRAEAEVTLAYRNRYQDIYVLYQPYTFQDNQPLGLKSPTSWALGVTVPLPLYNRNQGNIQRAKLNVTQTQTELAALERQVATQVLIAEKEYQVTRAAVQRIEGEMLPDAKVVLDDTLRLFRGGELTVIFYLTAQREYNDIVRQYRDTLARHRRSMLGLNTAIGCRILP